MQIVVLAGGLATRMHPDTEQVPKSLLPVNGRPFVDWQLDRFMASGARSVIFCVGHLGEQQYHLGCRPEAQQLAGARDGEATSLAAEPPAALEERGEERSSHSTGLPVVSGSVNRNQ